MNQKTYQNSIFTDEFSGASFGDKRLTERLKKIVESVSASPSESFPEAMGSEGALEGTYRFLGNLRVTPDRILAPHLVATAGRISKQQEVIIIHDTTVFSFLAESTRIGLYQMTKEKQSFNGHYALAVSNDSSDQPLGIIGAHTYVRSGKKKRRSFKERATDQSCESRRWMKLVEESESRLPQTVKPIHVMDREADFYQLFNFMSERDSRFVIRIFHDRKLESEEGMFSVLKELPQVYEREVPLSKRKKKKLLDRERYNPARNYRLAKLVFSACKVEIAPPSHLKFRGYQDSLSLKVVHVREVDVPKGLTPVDWKLITTENIDTVDEIISVVDTYRKRWIIEEYFKALKTGCSFEKRQLESKKTLLNALAVFVPIAWRILLLRALSRTTPSAKASIALTPTQIRVLRATSKKTLPQSLTAEMALLAIARLGGHLKRNGLPGWQIIWRGYDKLLTLEQGWTAAIERCDLS